LATSFRAILPCSLKMNRADANKLGMSSVRTNGWL
jgi:hypothetical protein